MRVTSVNLSLPGGGANPAFAGMWGLRGLFRASLASPSERGTHRLIRSVPDDPYHMRILRTPLSSIKGAITTLLEAARELYPRRDGPVPPHHP